MQIQMQPSALIQYLISQWGGVVGGFLNLKLTRHVGGNVDLGVEPLVGQQLRYSVQSLHGEGVVGVWEQIDHRHRPLCQADLLRDEADAGATRLTLPRHTPLARHAVGQIRPAPRVRRGSPLQDQRRLFQGADQVSGWRRWSLKNGREITFINSAAAGISMILFDKKNLPNTKQPCSKG